jgi:biotin carboxylase
MKKHILVIGGRDHTIQKLKNLKIDFTLFQTPNLTTQEQITSAKRMVICNYENTNEVVDIAKSIHEIDKFDAIVSFAEYAMYTATICAKELDLPCNDIKPVIYTRDKIKMRALLAENNIGTVKYKVCKNIADVKDFFINVNKEPIIIKPFSGGGSRGISLIQEETEIEKAWNWTCENGILPILAEEYIDGSEFSVESISLSGLHEVAMITEKVTTHFPHFIETGHQAPADLSLITKQEIEKLIIQFLDLIGQKTAPAHTEIKLSKNGLKIIESQTRIGGDQIWEMTEMITGIDLMSETICHLLQLPAPNREPKINAAAIRFFTYENQVIEEITNIDEVKKLPNIIRVNCTLKPGQKLGELKSSECRQGYIFCKGNTLIEAINNAEFAKKQVLITSKKI